MIKLMMIVVKKDLHQQDKHYIPSASSLNGPPVVSTSRPDHWSLVCL